MLNSDTQRERNKRKEWSREVGSEGMWDREDLIGLSLKRVHGDMRSLPAALSLVHASMGKPRESDISLTVHLLMRALRDQSTRSVWTHSVPHGNTYAPLAGLNRYTRTYSYICYTRPSLRRNLPWRQVNLLSLRYLKPCQKKRYYVAMNIYKSYASDSPFSLTNREFVLFSETV